MMNKETGRYKIGPNGYRPYAWLDIPKSTLKTHEDSIRKELNYVELESNSQSLVYRLTYNAYVFLLREDKLVDLGGVEIFAKEKFPSRLLEDFVSLIGGEKENLDIYPDHVEEVNVKAKAKVKLTDRIKEKIKEKRDVAVDVEEEYQPIFSFPDFSLKVVQRVVESVIASILKIK